MLQESQKKMTSYGRQTSAILTSAPPNFVNLSQGSMPKLHQHSLLDELSQNQLSHQQASQQQMASHILLQSVPQHLNPVRRELQQRIPTFGSSLQQQNQLFQSQSVDPEALPYLTAQTSNVNGEDWQGMYQKYDSRPRRPRNEHVEKFRHNKNKLERVVKFLQMNNTDIQRTCKNWDELLALEAKIIEVIDVVRKRHNHQSQIVNVQHELPQTQNSQKASPDNQMNSQVQPTNLQIQLDGAHINVPTAVSSKSNAVEHSHGRLTKVPNHALIEEIAELNQRLIDTEVEIIDEDVVQTAVASAAEGIMVKCSYKAVALSPTLKYMLTSAQMCHIQPLILLVPTDYPNSSPIHLDKSPAAVSGEYEYFSMKVKSKFNISLRHLSQPVSLSEVARTWDICVRAVVSEFAQQRGGGTFSTKYGVL